MSSWLLHKLREGGTKRVTARWLDRLFAAARPSFSQRDGTRSDFGIVLPAQRPSNEAESIIWLVDQVPELGPLLEEHVTFNEELLAYVLFEGDFLGWFVERVRAGDYEPAARFVAAIEPLMTTEVEPAADDRVWNLTAVCFVEGMVMQGTWDDVIETARPWMGRNTSRDVDRQFRYRSGELPPTA